MPSSAGGAHRKPPPPRPQRDLMERWMESGVTLLAIFVMSLLGLALFLMIVVK